ncbi:hypothetical protein MHYP_G00203870 [Metynnis hypsauchen]
MRVTTEEQGEGAIRAVCSSLKLPMYCKPLVDALQEGLQQRFRDMLVEPEFIAAAILVPKFKTSWTSDENVVKLGLDYIKDHLEEEASNQSPVDGSSASDDENFLASMKPTHGQEGIKQLDGYIACKFDDKEIPSSLQIVFEGEYCFACFCCL